MRLLQPAITHKSTFTVGEAELCSSRRHQFHCRNWRLCPLNQYFQHFTTTHRLGSSVLRVLGTSACTEIILCGVDALLCCFMVVKFYWWVSVFAGAHRPMRRELPHSEKMERIILCNFCLPFPDQTLSFAYTMIPALLWRGERFLAGISEEMITAAMGCLGHSSRTQSNMK